MKGVALIIILLLLSSFHNAVSHSYENIDFCGGILYVGGSGPGNYSTIQDAINDARAGDTIFVFNGTYHENVVIDKSVKLIGEDVERAIIDGERKNNTITILANSVFVTNFTIRNGSVGIFVGSRLYEEKPDGIVIERNIVCDNLQEGISLWHSNHCLIYGNTISNDTWGVCLYGSYFNTIVSNNLIKNEENAHVYYWKNWPLFWTNRFMRNYWDNWRIPLPKPILASFYPIYPLIQFDFLPRIFPYQMK